mmetsp:Transcript_62451/g.149055  ORF Transcript_62451/g.149055 Transcript_62451/m.149055 type:complete len:262 (+) Transcript_62451:1252-2037(+)
MDNISRHCHLWSIEDRRLVHVIPCVDILGCARVLVVRKLLCPQLAHTRMREIWVHGRAWPAPAFEVTLRRVWIDHLSGLPRSLVGRVRDLGDLILAILSLVPPLWLLRLRVIDLVFLHPIRWLGIIGVIDILPIDLLGKVAFIADVLIHLVAILLLDVGVNNRNEFSLGSGDALHHLLRRWEIAGVPSKILLAIRVLDVEPDNIHWQVILIKVLVDHLHILLISVVPAALMLAQGKQGWQRRKACEGMPLLHDTGRCGAQE